MEALHDPFQLFIVELLKILLPTLITLLVTLTGWFLGKAGKFVLALLKANLNQRQFWMLTDIVNTAVHAAEQTGLTDELLKAGAEKKNLAITIVQNTLRARGYDKLADNVDEISALIEASVHQSLTQGKLSAERLATFEADGPGITTSTSGITFTKI